MYKQIDFTQQGGLPLTQDTLNFLQNAYSDTLGAVAKTYGMYVILSGTQSTGGWCAINGEILPFDAFTGNNCYIEESLQDALYDDGALKLVYHSRKLLGGVTSVGQLSWSSFANIGTLISAVNALSSLTALVSVMDSNLSAHTSNLSNPHAVTKAQVGLGNLPNAKSNDPYAGDANVLATTLATSMIIKEIDTVLIGDPGAVSAGGRISNVVNTSNDTKLTISFMTAQTTTPRLVIPLVRAKDDVNWNSNNDVIVTLLGYDTNGFTVALREVASLVQSIYLTYIIL